jgi:chemotaxis protein MotA
MDLSTILGLAIGWGMVLIGMLLAAGGDIPLFIALFVNQPSSAAITIVGSLGGVMINFPMGLITNLGKVLPKAAIPDAKNAAYADLIEEMVNYATEARRNGVLALDAKTEEIEDDFIKNGIQLAVDGTAPEQIEEIMQLELESLQRRHEDNQNVLMKWAELAPAFGMIGTLVGLIAMLANLSDPDSIGPSMAIALITTMYGSMVANMVCIPIAGKLKERTKEEIVRKEMIISGILSIQNGDNPRIVQQKLATFVPPSIKATLSSEEEGT